MFDFLILLLMAIMLVGWGLEISDENVFRSFLFIFLCVAGICLAIAAEERGYKRGQVDAINGELRYEAQINQDTTYVEIKN